VSKRKLTHQQSRRIAAQQQSSRRKARDSDSLTDDTSLGIEQRGLVITHYGKQAEIEDEHGVKHRCHIRANIKELVTGDRIVWRASDDIGVITSIEPSRNRLYRPDIYGKMRPVAANIDTMLITIASEPEPFAGLIDRYIVAAENLDITPVLLINKSDLLQAEKRTKMEATTAIYTQLGYNVIEVSAKLLDGFRDLKTALQDKTSIFVGQSGVGKSSLIQSLLPDEELKVGELSAEVSKGKHTTTHSRLYHFESGGDCIDSPGIREFGLWHLDAAEVIYGFVELRELAGHCKFRDCKHQIEPHCAIAEALEKGAICSTRFESYLRIVESLNDVSVRAPSSP
jgi:ribosome small subunit-dependent GTPase A